ncbi:lipase 3 [Zeugodacus cucurbitae]|nr:lipase 3 [Zeugodacus cucurbitae]
MWLNLTWLILVLATANAVDWDPYLDIPFKPLKTSADRIRDHGYPAESHFVETSDGYLLNVFRIPYSHKLNNANARRPVVYLQHGLFSCSDCFLLNGPDNAIAYLFADAGFDVWLGNGRGNIYSRNNTKMSLNSTNFWQFSWHEIGAIDLPDTIDYILEKTGEKQLHYVGHSQGGTSYFVLTSFRPEYNAKVRSAHLLAPAVFMGNTTHPLVHLFKPYVSVPGGSGMRLLGDQMFIPHNMLAQRALDTACGGEPRFPEFCRTLFYTWAGTEASNINATLLPYIAETHPAGISTNQGIHYIQLHNSNFFRQYDHGVQKNRKVYAQAEPPNYQLENVSADTYVYYGMSDTSVNWQDIQRLPEHISSLKLLYKVPDESWGHIDFIFAMKVKETINEQVINYCKQYEIDGVIKEN